MSGNVVMLGMKVNPDIRRARSASDGRDLDRWSCAQLCKASTDWAIIGLSDERDPRH
jgi:hypothetical protein